MNDEIHMQNKNLSATAEHFTNACEKQLYLILLAYWHNPTGVFKFLIGGVSVLLGASV